MRVELPDGTALELEDGATGEDAARAIGEGLARAALAVKQNGDIRDLSAPLLDGGFYYDFEFPEGVTIGEGDLERIEGKMREHIKADEPFEREDVTASAALQRFRDDDQPYKVELIEDLVRDQGVETVSLYRNGPFVDLCRGPHGPSTKRD